jgi:hypothetical protein
MRSSVLAARKGELAINIVLTTAASVKGSIVFILVLSLVALFVFDTGYTLTAPPAISYGV